MFNLRREFVVISIHALREEGDVVPRGRNALEGISIHALREEGDACSIPWRPAGKFCTPRPPGGGKRPPVFVLLRFSLFLSTPSARRATQQTPYVGYPYYISIHALREEGDGDMTRSAFTRL